MAKSLSMKKKNPHTGKKKPKLAKTAYRWPYTFSSSFFLKGRHASFLFCYCFGGAEDQGEAAEEIMFKCKDSI